MNHNLKALISDADKYALLNTLIENNIVKMEDALQKLIEMHNGYNIYIFACYVSNAPMERLVDALIKLGNADNMVYFASRLDLEEKLVVKLAEAVIQKGYAEYIYEFARAVKNAPIDLLANGIIQANDAEYIISFASDITNAPIEKLANAIINTENSSFIYAFAYRVFNAPVGKLAQAIIKNGNPEYLFFFANNIKNAPIDDLAQALLKTNNAKYIYHFARDVESAPIVELVNRLVEMQSFKYIALVLAEITNIEEESKSGDLESYAKKHMNELLKVMSKCQSVKLLKNAQSYMNTTYLFLYFDKLIERLNLLKNKLENSKKKALTSRNIEELNEKEQLAYLQKLFANKDFVTIKENQAVFKYLFENEDQEERGR